VNLSHLDIFRHHKNEHLNPAAKFYYHMHSVRSCMYPVAACITSALTLDSATMAGRASGLYKALHQQLGTRLTCSFKMLLINKCECTTGTDGLPAFFTWQTLHFH